MKTLLDREDLIFNPPQLGCVLYLSGFPGGGNKIHDRSPYGNQGSITGATWKRLPSGLWCLSFDGSDDYVDCGSAIGPTLTPPFTIEAWAMRTKGSYNTIFANPPGGNANGFWFNITTYLDFRTFPNARETWGGTISQDTWYHVVAVLDGATATLYINGSEPSTSHADHSDYTVSSSVLKVGILIAADYPFGGYIALPRIHRRALSAFDVQNSFNREKHLFGVW